MNKFFKKTSNFIFAKQTSIFSSALIISSMIVLTSISGFLRYRILATYFSKEQLDLFFASFKIPDLIFEILITGALTTSFIPIYLNYKNNKEELKINISSIINIIFLVLTIFIFIINLFLKPIITFITPGFSQEKIQTVILFSRILLIGQLPFFIIGSILTGIGQANKIFFLSGLAPVLYNLSIISFTLFLHNRLNLLAPIFGVVFGSFIMFLIQAPVIKYTDFKYQLIIKKTKAVIDFFKIIIPRTLTVITAQIDATIDLILASLLKPGSYTIFYFAQHLQLLPVSVIGIALGQASLPYLTEVYKEKKINEFKNIIAQSILNIFFIILPVAVFFIFARTPLIRVFFGGQKFDWQATNDTAITLSFFALGLPFHSVYYLLTRSFYAMIDSKTPFLISSIAIFFNIILSLLFVFYFHLPVYFLAVSFSFSIFLNSFLLFLILNKKLNGFDIKNIFYSVLKILLSSFISGIISYFLMRFLDGLIFNTAFSINVFFLLLTTFFIFIASYIFFCWIIEVKEIYLIAKILLKVKEYQKKFLELYNQYE
ncbi:MAG: murein biosynthesis integral membrane protein MurJ [Patescibacteria group bacterium]|nr:murein biosynthesis integral membrane protein MurJ [Patescibacteria group bacterium]